MRVSPTVLCAAAFVVCIVLYAGASLRFNPLRQWDNGDARWMRVTDLSGRSTDMRGWITGPFKALGVEFNCVDLHVGTILPGHVRGNHRHHTKSEVLFTWGARTQWRIEDRNSELGYTDVTLGETEQMAVYLPVGSGHLIRNLDTKPLFLAGCADAEFDPANPQTDYDIWKSDYKLIPQKPEATSS